MVGSEKAIYMGLPIIVMGVVMADNRVDYREGGETYILVIVDKEKKHLNIELFVVHSFSIHLESWRKFFELRSITTSLRRKRF